MNSIDSLTQFFGWCTVINIAIYLLTAIASVVLRGMVVRVNTRAFAISQQDVGRITMQYLGQYKLAITVLCFAPYIALKFMS